MAKSVPFRIAGVLILIAVGVGVYLIHQYTHGRSLYIADGCEIPASFEMLHATHTVSPSHPIALTAPSDQPVDRRYLVSEAGHTITIQDVELGKVVCTFPAGS
ncbi:hypothetical protein HNR17_000856 [Galbitalea soli]|nr:hypothetical protein [Galbitalea soli]